jgi:hypothetical protein
MVLTMEHTTALMSKNSSCMIEQYYHLTYLHYLQNFSTDEVNLPLWMGKETGCLTCIVKFAN